MKPITPKNIAKYWSRIDVRGLDECWPWTASQSLRGYGSFGNSNAHRFGLSLLIGRPLTEKEVACHSCDNPECQNPCHLWVGDAQSNMTDKMNKGRHWVRKGVDRADTILTEKQVLEIVARRNKGELLKDIAKDYPVGWRIIQKITCGVNWSHLTGIKYVKKVDPVLNSVEAGQQVADLRLSKGLSQGDLAKMIHMPQSYLCSLERGKIPFRHSTMERILKGLTS